MFDVGDRVEINHPGEPDLHGRRGVVKKSDGKCATIFTDNHLAILAYYEHLLPVTDEPVLEDMSDGNYEID